MADRAQQMRDIVLRFRESVSGFAAVDEEQPTPRLLSLRAHPFNPQAARVSLIVSERGVLVEIGDGGRFELGIEARDREFLEQLLEATLQGRVSEDVTARRVAFRASLADGRDAASVAHRFTLGRRGLRQYEPWGTFSR
jgi:hypothetical protein